MSEHDKLLEQGARTAPEPETAEERSKHLGLKAGGGALAGGAVAAAKLGVLGKAFIWFFAWHGVVSAWRIGSWIGLAIVLLVLTLLFVRHARSEA
jgi:uncharacterized membrane protein